MISWNNNWAEQRMNKVLVVDDEKDIGILMKSMLKSSRYIVVYASNIDEATKELMNDAFETVFLDLNLDNEYGLNLVDTIRATNKEANIVIITAQKPSEIKQEVTSHGIEHLIEKPFNKSQILSALGSVGE